MRKYRGQATLRWRRRPEPPLPADETVRIGGHGTARETMSRLFLVRHGPTHLKGMVGWSDPPADLTDTPALARLDAHLPKDALLVSSDLRRAVTTADAIAAGRRRLAHDRDLREMNFGAWELKSHADLEAEDPVRMQAFWERPGEVRPPGGESWDMLRSRADAAIRRLLLAHPGRDLIVVAHFGLILTQVQRALRLDAEEVLAQRIDNLSVTEIHTVSEPWTVGRINHRP